MKYTAVYIVKNRKYMRGLTNLDVALRSLTCILHIGADTLLGFFLSQAAFTS